MCLPYQFPKPQGLSKLLPEKVWLTTLDVQSLNLDLNLPSGLYDFKNLELDKLPILIPLLIPNLKDLLTF